MNTHSRISVLLLLMVMMALMLRSTAQDDLIPMPTSESTADPVLTPEILVPLLTPSDGAVFSEDEDFQFDWLPIPEAHHYQLKLERDGVFYGQIDFSSGSICSPTICEVYPPLFNLPPLEAGHTYAWSITAQTPQGNIASLKPTFTITYFVAGFEVATDEWSDPATANPTWILYADSFGLSILDPNLPNTDPFFDRRILVSNGSNIAGNFGLITHPVWKPDTRTLAFVGATSYRNGIGELVFYPRDIWTMRASGQQLQQLTFTSETEQQLAWSPDGSKIAFAVYDSVTSLWQVKVIDATFGNLLLTLPGASFPQWHRQSQRLAYVSTNRIMRYDFTDGSTVQIAAPMAEGYAYLDWYVGGGRNEFLYHNVRGIWKYDAVTATHTQLTFNWHLFANPSGTYVDQSPDWSPTGQRILLERRYLNSYTTLGVILPDGTRFRPLTRANSTTPYIQANGHVDWANNFSAILTPTPTPSRTMTLTPPPILCPPTGPRVPACEALTATPTNTLTPTNTPTPTFTPTPSPVCVFVGFNATYYRAPITFNPPLGSLNYSSSYHYMATKRFVERVDPTRTEDQVWYYIEWLEQVGQPQVNEDLGVWIKAPIAPPTGGSGCQNGNGLPIDTTYTIPNHSWAAFNIATPLFAQWPIDITEICSGTGLREIHALGFGDAASYPRNTHNGIDLYVTDVTNPNDLPTVVVQSIDVGIVVGIGITTWDSREQRYIPDISNTHANWGASSQRYGDPSQEQAGYSVIIRHGHFYVLYGHLHTISDDLWVGKGVSSGTNLGTLGKFNERHLHIEIHSYGSNIAGPNGSLPPTFADLIGVTGILYLLTNQRRTLLHLTSMI